MKKLLFVLLLSISTIAAKAQFEQGTKMADLSFSGLEMSYSDNQKFTFGVEASMGYFVEDCWMIYTKLGYSHRNKYDHLQIGAGGRYYIEQNGLFLGLGCMYEHANPNFNNVFLTPHVGYAFYLNHYLTIEPSLFYDISLNDFSNGSKVGLKVGFGYYF